jgi:hypothetical protein
MLNGADTETQWNGHNYQAHLNFFEINVWHHVTVTFSNGNYSLYLDGVNIFNKQLTWTYGDVNILLLNQNAYFDEIYFSPVALSADNINILYTSNSLCGPCSPNTYCASGIVYSCPSGSQSPSASTSLASCTCLPGFAPVAGGGLCVPCSTGFYCPGGSVLSKTVSIQCPAGFFCPQSSTAPTPCANGSSCPAGSSSQQQCPAGFYCTNPAFAPVACPSGAFCVIGSTAPTPCPANTFSTLQQQVSPGVCTPCSSCGIGTYQAGQCTVSKDVVCTPCTNKPAQAVYLATTSSCPWICLGGYFGPGCTACSTGMWCQSGTANQCPSDSSSPPLSTFQNNCTCNPGYVSFGSVSGTGPCSKCQPGQVCPGGGTITVEISTTPLELPTQVVLVQQTLPPADNFVSLLVGIPDRIAALNLPAGVTVFTRKVCRGTYCANCDGTPQCVQSVVVGMGQDAFGKYTFNVSSLNSDTLYTFAPVEGTCFPVMNVSLEYVTGLQLAVTAVSGISSVPFVCRSNARATTNLLLSGGVQQGRRLLMSEKWPRLYNPSSSSSAILGSYVPKNKVYLGRKLLQTSGANGDSIAMSVIVQANQTNATRQAVTMANLTIQGYTPVVSPTATAALSCPANSTSPIGSTSISQCVCNPGYQGDASLGKDCTPCSPGTFCSGGLLGLCASNAGTPPMSSSVSDCKCNPGFYGAPTSCVQCPVNAYCPGGNVIQNCSSNAVSSAQSQSSEACYCKSGYYGARNGPCFLCEAGSWCWTGVKNVCPDYSMSSSGSSRLTDCACIDGYQDLANGSSTSRVCLMCGVGVYCKVRFPIECILEHRVFHIRDDSLGILFASFMLFFHHIRH